MRSREHIRKPTTLPRAPQPPPPSLLARLPALMEAARRAWLPVWVLLPLRLFLSVTFIYAGLQKLTDPQYFRPSARGYIGKQIAGFAVGSPLHDLLLHVIVPHAPVYGALIAYGELAIGLGTLMGLLLRPAAFFGALLSLIFFLSASWRVYPYFYGSDIVFLFGWITMLLAGPTAGGWPSLDALLATKLLERAPPARREALAGVLAFALGVNPYHGALAHAGESETVPAQITAARPRATHGQPARGPRGMSYAQARARSRRDFMRGALSGAAGMLAIVFVVSLFRQGDGAASGSLAPPASNPAGGAATPNTTASGSDVIAQASQVPENSAATFTIPANSDPGVVVHLSSGKFVAFDATCTHAGCPVQYDPQSRLLLCPCHGAAFDPANNAAVVQGPTDTPLTPVNIQVNSSSGAITIAS